MEPERPIEKALRASAAKRRKAAGPPLEVPAVTRQRLQAEVARRHRDQDKSRAGWGAKLPHWWPRIAWPVAICAVLVILGWQFLPSKKSQSNHNQLVRNEPAAADPFSREQPSAKAKSSAEVGGGSGLEHESARTEPIAETKNLEHTSDRFSATTPSELAVVNERAPLAKSEADRAFAPGALPAAAVDALTESRTKMIDSNADLATGPKEKIVSGSIQHFASAPSAAGGVAALAKSSATQPVLSSFDAQQNGRELRIVDADGSVYQGFVQPANASVRTRQIAPESSSITRAQRSADTRSGSVLGVAPALSAHSFPVTQQYVFRVAGTNETLKQLVVFSGSFFAPTNAPVLSNTPVSGRFSIGQGNEFPLSAHPSAK